MKKLSILFTAAILIMSGCSKTDDLPGGNIQDHQLKSGDTKTENIYFHPNEDAYYAPIICDGEVVDMLFGNEESLTAHAREHYENGKLVWAQVSVKGSLQSQTTGETYKINELNKIFFNEDEELVDFTCRTHARGDMGHNVIVFYAIIDFENQISDVVKAICVN